MSAALPLLGLHAVPYPGRPLLVTAGKRRVTNGTSAVTSQMTVGNGFEPSITVSVTC